MKIHYPKLNRFKEKQMIPNRLYVQSQDVFELSVCYDVEDGLRFELHSLKTKELMLSHKIMQKCSD